MHSTAPLAAAVLAALALVCCAARLAHAYNISASLEEVAHDVEGMHTALRRIDNTMAILRAYAASMASGPPPAGPPARSSDRGEPRQPRAIPENEELTERDDFAEDEFSGELAHAPAPMHAAEREDKYARRVREVSRVLARVSDYEAEPVIVEDELSFFILVRGSRFHALRRTLGAIHAYAFGHRIHVVGVDFTEDQRKMLATYWFVSAMMTKSRAGEDDAKLLGRCLRGVIRKLRRAGKNAEHRLFVLPAGSLLRVPVCGLDRAQPEWPVVEVGREGAVTSLHITPETIETWTRTPLMQAMTSRLDEWTAPKTVAHGSENRRGGPAGPLCYLHAHIESAPAPDEPRPARLLNNGKLLFELPAHNRPPSEGKPKMCLCIATVGALSEDKKQRPVFHSLQQVVMDSVSDMVLTPEVMQRMDVDLYLGTQSGDYSWDDLEWRARAANHFNNSILGRMRTRVIRYPLTSPLVDIVSKYNMLIAQAVTDGCDYLVQWSDDAEFNAKNWPLKMAQELTSQRGFGTWAMADSAYGDAGDGTYTLGASGALHVHLNGWFWPPILKNWFADDYLAKAYGRFSFRHKDIKMTNVQTYGQRYASCAHAVEHRVAVLFTRAKAIKWFREHWPERADEAAAELDEAVQMIRDLASKQVKNSAASGPAVSNHISKHAQFTSERCWHVLGWGELGSVTFESVFERLADLPL